MFCTLLRKRSEWAPMLPKLLSSQTPRWTGDLSSYWLRPCLTGVTTEKTLGTHDIAIPLPRRDVQGNYVRMLLLSASDMRPGADGASRIERLYHLDGGHHVAIVFLLDNKGGKEDGVKAYMDLQAR
jgi:hypothetical protein